MTKIGILGSAGRMGKAVAAAIEEVDEASFAGGADKDDDAPSLAGNCDVLIDFSTPDALARHLDAAVEAGIPLVIGTTGLNAEHDQAIETAARQVPLLRSANMSLGVNLLAHLVGQAAAKLGPDWDIEIVEMHHRMKSDAPSGTALALGEAAARGRGKPLKAERGRDGTGLRRAEGAIGFASLRGGTVAGDHDVVFAGTDERLILSHRAESRAIFARGALAAARFLHGQPAGLYSMRDVVDSL